MRKEKQYLFDEIEGQLEGNSSFVVVSYEKMEPNLSWSFRTSLKEVGADLEVVKKRIFFKVLQKKQIESTLSDLSGSIGVILAGQDVIGASKKVVKFNEENENRIKPIFAFSENVLYTAAEVKKLAELPSQEEMRAQFLGTLQAPMAETLSVIEGLLTSVMYCLENKAKSS